MSINYNDPLDSMKGQFFQLPFKKSFSPAFNTTRQP